MSWKGVTKSLDDIERKLGKANKIAAKGDSISYKDAIKLGAKSNSICSTIKKGIKEYGSFDPNEDEAKALLHKMTTVGALVNAQTGSGEDAVSEQRSSPGNGFLFFDQMWLIQPENFDFDFSAIGDVMLDGGLIT